MGRPKKQIDLKESVRLRERARAKGRTVLYLDIYYKGKRTYEFLNLYLVPETDAESKQANANTLAQANAIKEERIRDLTNAIAGIKDNSHKAKMSFSEWVRICTDESRKRCKASTIVWRERVAREVAAYDPGTTLAEVDKEYLLKFLNHLATRKALNTDKKQMAKSTVYQYMTTLRTFLNKAVRDSLIPRSPFKGITKSSLAVKEHKREYLTVDEVKRLMATPCPQEGVKAAFLFSCFSGLRISDVASLRWKDITKTSTHWQVEVVQYKTGAALYLPLNMSARRWLPEQAPGASPDDRLFPRLTAHYDRSLRPWVEKAGIDKPVSFHVTRHTFATLCLTAGIDIHTTSQLLGHASLRCTLPYAALLGGR